MINLKLNHLLQTKHCYIFFVYNLFICDIALAAWGQDCCEMYYRVETNKVTIYFKFFEHYPLLNKKSSFLEKFEALYSSDEGRNYTHLMTTSCKAQTTTTWAWIDIQRKKDGEKLFFDFHPLHQSKTISMQWGDGLNIRLKVINSNKDKNQTWICVRWLLREDQNNITHMQIRAKWAKYGISTNITTIMNYGLNEMNERLE